MAEKRKGWRSKSEHLSAKERRDMPRSDFALLGKGSGPEGKGSGSYPIPDASHARSALARASANASPAEQSQIRRRVHEKFPSMSLKERADRRYGRTD